jgi:hypothetical protein
VVDSQLSEHQCEGWLEGYLLTGRHGLFNSYEAFIRIVDSMFSQHAKWLKVTLELPWRRKIASLNYLLASHVWQQDHNGFTHQDPGFLDHVINKKADVVRVYLPAGRQLPVVGVRPLPAQPPLRQRRRRGKARAAAMALHGAGGRFIARRASASGNGRATTRAPNPTSSWPAAATRRRWRCSPRSRSCRENLPDVKIRVVNVVDLMRLQPCAEHPHGLSDTDYDSLFTKDKPIIFNFHGYASLVHGLTYRRANRRLHVAATRRRARSPPPSTCACRTRSIGSIWSGRRRQSGASGQQGRLSQAEDARQADRAQTFHRRARRGSAGDSQLEMVKQTLGVPIADMIFVGDAIFPGGNDYPPSKPAWNRSGSATPTKPSGSSRRSARAWSRSWPSKRRGGAPVAAVGKVGATSSTF